MQVGGPVHLLFCSSHAVPQIGTQLGVQGLHWEFNGHCSTGQSAGRIQTPLFLTYPGAQMHLAGAITKFKVLSAAHLLVQLDSQHIWFVIGTSFGGHGISVNVDFTKFMSA